MIVRIIFLLSIIIFACSSTRYKLTVYQSLDCNYCKFASKQIQSLLSQNHWEDILTLRIVDCQKQIKLCRNSLTKPLLVMENSLGNKISQTGGVRSKIYFRDWIADIVNANPIQIQQVRQPNGKFKIIRVNNSKEVRQYFKLEVERQRKIKNDKFDIIKQAKKYALQWQGTDQLKQNAKNKKPGQLQTNLKEQNLKQNQDSFRRNFRRLAMICSCALVIIIIIGIIMASKGYFNQQNGQNNSIRIPSTDED